MWIGEAIWLAFAVFGLAAVAQSFHAVFVALKWAGVVYLIYLAWKMWHAPVHVSAEALPERGSAVRLFAAGLAVTLGNPKIMVFYLALLPTIVDLSHLSLKGWFELTATMLAVLIMIDLLWVFLAARARRLFASPRALRAVNRYGAFKIEAEEWVRLKCPVPSATLRPILMYGWPLPGGRQNVVTRWLADLGQGRPIQVARDLDSKPLLARNCAEAVWACVVRRRTGIYHVAGADRLSLLEFARQTARVFGHDERLVRPATPRYLNQFTTRPRDTSYVTTKMEQDLGVRPIGTLEGLAMMRRVGIANEQEICRCVS